MVAFPYNLAALFLSNAGVMPTVSPSYGVVNKFLLPLAVPLLLLTADMRKVITSTGRLLWCFFIGAIGTTLGGAAVQQPSRPISIHQLLGGFAFIFVYYMVFVLRPK